ncbi:MAG TPA: orotidine-5'-phosphate decarboxylase [bacterium (Candidatus Stahlbacteria)]|nr:orotidine-5'-phosphate decarboxylase [Candidatus Stahlbacteria bacterium]
MVDRIIVSLDIKDRNRIEELLDLLSPIGYYKIGPIPFTLFGPELINFVKRRGKKIFLDLKFHDIPSTVAGSCEGAVKLGVDMLNLHTLGGFEMMERALESILITAKNLRKPKPILLGVTILTSIDEASFNDLLGPVERSLNDQIISLARLAKSAGLDGVVSSVDRTGPIKDACGKDFLVVTPGVRPKGFDVGDHARVFTPKEAFSVGADYIVIGRPITAAADPKAALSGIIKELG